MHGLPNLKIEISTFKVISLSAYNSFKVPIAVAVRSKACVCGRSLAGIAGSNPADCMYVCLL